MDKKCPVDIFSNFSIFNSIHFKLLIVLFFYVINVNIFSSTLCHIAEVNWLINIVSCRFQTQNAMFVLICKSQFLCVCVCVCVGKEDGKTCKRIAIRTTIRKDDCRSNAPVSVKERYEHYYSLFCSVL